MKNSSLRSVVLLWGGTGGHIFPLVSLKKALFKEGFGPFYWIGERDSLEERIAKGESIEFRPVRSWKLRRYFSWKTFIEPLNILAGFFQSLRILRQIRPAFVFSKGGYVSLPAAIAAKVLGIPVYLQESDAIPGLANRWVGRFSKTVFLGFSEAEKYFPGRECILSGQLLDPTIPWGNFPDIVKTDRSRVLAVGGSLGSTRVFDGVFQTARNFPDMDFEIVLGKLNLSLRSKFEELPNVVCHDFLSQIEMARAYFRASLVVTRAGATTLAEIEASGARMVIIPLEGSANGHQRANAAAYRKRGSRVLFESDLSRLPEVIREMLNSEISASQNKNPNPEGEGIFKVIRVLSERVVPFPNTLS